MRQQRMIMGLCRPGPKSRPLVREGAQLQIQNISRAREEKEKKKKLGKADQLTVGHNITSVSNNLQS
jgi:hypothetical protein